MKCFLFFISSHSPCDQFLQQYAHYRALLRLFLLNPSHESGKLEELVMFLSQVSHDFLYCAIKMFNAQLQYVAKIAY